MGIGSFFAGVALATPITAFFTSMVSRISDPDVWSGVFKTVTEKTVEVAPKIVAKSAEESTSILKLLTGQ